MARRTRPAKFIRPFETAAAPTVGSVVAGVCLAAAMPWAAPLVAEFWLAACVVALVVAGAFGARRLFRRRRALALRRRGVPVWEVDWPGEPTVLLRSFFAASVPRWVFPLVILLFAGSTALVVRTRSWEARAAGTGVPVLLASATVAWAVARGRLQVQWERFPIPVGRPVTLWLATTAGSPRLADVWVRLRCHTPFVDSCGRKLVTPELEFWTEEHRLETGSEPGPDEFVPVTFDLPEDVPGTDLVSWPQVTWTLTVEGRSRWGRIEEKFLLPVYALAAAPPARG